MVEAQLAQLLAAEPDLEFAVLVGSRAHGTARPDSDWDIALQWARHLDGMQNIEKTENLRRRLAGMLAVGDDRLDLIDIPRASLAMRALVAEEGRVLAGEDTLAWRHFLSRTWRELEDWYWEQAHAA